MERHQNVALALFAAMTAILLLRYGFAQPAWPRIGLLFVVLMLILLYRAIAHFARFGLMQYFATDFRARQQPAAFAFLFWLVYVIALLAVYFE